jgi:hypothetical protein
MSNPDQQLLQIFPKASIHQNLMLKKAYTCFGNETLLVPVKQGQIDADLKQATLKNSYSDTWQQRLNDDDIAVCCGIESHGLCAIRFENKVRLDAFLDTNPALRETTLTSSPQGYFLWLRLTAGGFCPGSHQFADFQWISEGSVIVSKREMCSHWRFENEFKPLAIAFDQLVWPVEAVTTFAYESLAHQFPITVKDRHGRLILNDRMVAATFALQNSVFFDPALQRFFSEDGQKTWLYDEVVKLRLLKVLDYFAIFGTKYGYSVDTGARHLNQILDLLRIVCVRQPVDEDVAIATFVEAQLTPTVGRDVTIGEAYASYLDYCSRQKRPAFAKSEFQNRIAGAVKKRYGLARSHSILRDNRCVRGFHGLQVSQESAGDAWDVRDGGAAKN